ncbi:hypothetical protein FCV25MIE_29135 [Fagus crenata]
MGKQDAKSSKKAKTTKLVKKEKGSKASVSSDEIKIMPPLTTNAAKAPESSRAPSGHRVPVSPMTSERKEVQTQEFPPSMFKSQSRAIKHTREACESVDMEVYDDVNNKSLLCMCIHDMMK